MGKKLRSTEERLLELADRKALEFLEIDPGSKDFDLSRFEAIQKQATFGYRTKREHNLARRMEIDQKLRAVKMAIMDPDVRQAYIRISAPKLLPELTRRPS